MNLLFIPVLVLLAIVVVSVFYLITRYKKCPSDKVLVVYGKVGKDKSAKTIHGGGTMVWPYIQDYEFLSLTPMTIDIPLKGALSKQNIRINVPSTFTVGVSTDPVKMQKAAVRLLGLKVNEIEQMAQEIILGQLRLTVATLMIEEINQDREKFLDAIRENVEPELEKIGLELINVNITDLTDDSDYIVSIGQEAEAKAKNEAVVKVSEQNKLGAVGQAINDKTMKVQVATNNRERDVNVAVQFAESEKGKKKAEADKRVFVQAQEADAIKGENEAQANIADYNAGLVIKQSEALQRSQVAQQKAFAEIQKETAKANKEKLTAEQVVTREIEKQKVEIDAEAEAEKTRRIAKGEADAIYAKYEAEARGIQKVLDAKADGYRKLVEASGGNSQSAASLLMIEKLEKITEMQTAAISKIKFDKVVVWENGSGANGKTSTADFASGLIKSLPALNDVAAMAGYKLPDFLGSSVEGASTNGASNGSTKANKR